MESPMHLVWLARGNQGPWERYRCRAAPDSFTRSRYYSCLVASVYRSSCLVGMPNPRMETIPRASIATTPTTRSNTKDRHFFQIGFPRLRNAIWALFSPERIDRRYGGGASSRNDGGDESAERERERGNGERERVPSG